MIPAGLGNLEPQLLLWFVAMMRPGAAMLAAPLFGSTAMPIQVRIILSLAIGIPSAAASHFVLPIEGVMSVPGLLMVAGEVLLGLAFGFAINIGFAVALVAGETISNAMGLGFAAMSDPSTGHPSTAIGQFLNMLGTVVFLCMGGHLALIEIVVTSFETFPPGQGVIAPEALHGLVMFGGLMFAAGVTVALPVAFALILVQVVMGTITRSAPALNLFAVGIPATVLAGVIALAVATPELASGIEHALNLGLDRTQMLAGL